MAFALFPYFTGLFAKNRLKSYRNYINFVKIFILFFLYRMITQMQEYISYILKNVSDVHCLVMELFIF